MEVDAALAFGACIPRLLSRAAAIYGAAGRTAQAERHSRDAARLDPTVGDFRAFR
jgi:hypothetical protein